VGAKRFVPLSGVLGVLLLFAAFAVAGSTPNGKASVATIVSFYAEHRTAETVSGVLLSLGALAFLIFSATFAARLRNTETGGHGVSELCLAGAVVLVVGLTVYAGLSVAIADEVGHVQGSALQGLNVLADDAVFVFLITVGTSAFLLGAASAVLTGSLLPRWLGWLAVVLAVIGVIPSHVLGGTLDHVGFAAFIGLGVWTVIVSIILVTEVAPAE
jgi:hypothetical protein